MNEIITPIHTRVWIPNQPVLVYTDPSSSASVIRRLVGFGRGLDNQFRVTVEYEGIDTTYNVGEYDAFQFQQLALLETPLRRNMDKDLTAYSQHVRTMPGHPDFLKTLKLSESRWRNSTISYYRLMNAKALLLHEYYMTGQM